MGERDIYDRCRRFSGRTLRTLRGLKVDYLYRPLTLQLVRSSTSITANLLEASESVSKKDFVNKLGIALKEAKESTHWLELLSEAYPNSGLEELAEENIQLVKILASIKRKYLASSIG